MTDETPPSPGLLQRIDILVLMSSIVLLFVALGTEPWWILNGARTAKLFSVQVSPFFLRINAIGIPSSTPLATSLGYITRTMVLLGFLSLFAAAIRPKAWWRNAAVALGFTSLAELYLSFLMMLYWTETMFVSAYSATPPFYGTSILNGNVIGLDNAYYSNPLVTAAFSIPYYIGILSISLLVGQIAIKIFHDRALQVLKFLLPGGGIHDVFLTPPYQSVMFSSENKDFNPLGTDPASLTDDQLIVSFKRLYDTIEPGGNLSVVIPTTEPTLYDRFHRIIPYTGFTTEPEKLIYSSDGSPENELHFRRPEENLAGKPEQMVQAMQRQEPPAEESPIQPSVPVADISERQPVPTVLESPIETSPETVQGPEEKPTWANTKMTHQEHEILKVTTEILAHHQEPVPYRELLNQVYMELVEKKLDFDSAKQIEAILLDHNGREVQVVEHADNDQARIVKAWQLGNVKVGKQGGHRLPTLKVAHIKIPRVSRPFKKNSSGYRSHKGSEEDSSETS